MAIVAVQGRSDAKGTAWVLASATLESLRDATTASHRRVEINNTYRLLEAFSGSAYFSTPQPSLYPNIGRGPAASGMGGQENVAQVADAIQGALSDAFSGMTEGDAVAVVNDVLTSLYRDHLIDLEQPKVAKTISFFEAMKVRLDPIR